MSNRKGENHHLAKLSDEQVAEIRRKYLPYGYTAKMLSREYETPIQTIKDILQYRTRRKHETTT